MTFAQLSWIWGAGGLGILLASFHMNAVPFYVMVFVVLTLGRKWSWMQAIGAALVAAGVMVSQWVMYGKYGIPILQEQESVMYRKYGMPILQEQKSVMYRRYGMPILQEQKSVNSDL
jgi:hypothetical protein